MSRNIVSLWALVSLLFVGSALLGKSVSAQSYSLPNTNSGCPLNCRAIPWLDGSDLWNGGTLPIYSGATCSPLNENGSSDDTTNINNCITAASAGTGAYSACHAAGGCAVLIPAGTVYVNGTVRLKSNVAVRGAKAEGNSPGAAWLPTADTGATNIVFGANGQLTSQNFSSSSGSLYPSTSYGNIQSTCSLSGNPAKGDSTLTINSGGSCAVSVGTYIEVYGNDDPSLVYVIGTDGLCPWCGNNTGWYLQTQIVQVTGFVSGSGGAGSVVNISRPIYYPPYTTSVTVNGQVEPAGAKYTIIQFGTSKAGYENLRVDGSANDVGGNSMVLLQGCLYCWVKNVETYVTGSNSGSAHVEMDYSYGDEIRNNYLHDQRSGASGSGYGVYFQFVNGDAKIENNILRHNRHWIVFQGGGSGDAVLYNYADDGYTDDPTYLASGRTSHGAHPFFNLFEGNVISHISADDFSGTTSHDVFWRNWLWGDETENWTGAIAPTGTPGGGFDAVDLYEGQQYYSFIGNVLGSQATTSIPTGADDNCGITTTKPRHANWTAATLTTSCTTGNCGYESPDAPGVYSYGSSQLGSSATSSATITRNGNYDYKTLGVAFWDGGSTNNTFATSLYYGSKPAFLGACRWPVAGYDQSPVYGMNAAEATYLGANVGTTSSSPPAPPSGASATAK